MAAGAAALLALRPALRRWDAAAEPPLEPAQGRTALELQIDGAEAAP